MKPWPSITRTSSCVLMSEKLIGRRFRRTAWILLRKPRHTELGRAQTVPVTTRLVATILRQRRAIEAGVSRLERRRRRRLSAGRAQADRLSDQRRPVRVTETAAPDIVSLRFRSLASLFADGAQTAVAGVVD
jgi:hypothetical protein